MEEQVEELPVSTDFLCTECGKMYSSRSNLLRHVKIHKELEHQCPICNKEFAQKEQLLRHIRIKYLGIKNHVCPFCKLRVSTKANMIKHIELIHVQNMNMAATYKCEICGSYYKTKKVLHKHITQRHPLNVENKDSEVTKHRKSTDSRNGTDPYLKEACENFQSVLNNDHCISKPNVMTVKKVVENRKIRYKCDICKNTFNKFSALTLHMKKHSTEKPYKCPHCDSAFGVMSLLRRHLKIVHCIKCKSNVNADLWIAINTPKSDLIVKTQSDPIRIIKKTKISNVQQRNENYEDAEVEPNIGKVEKKEVLSMPLLDEGIVIPVVEMPKNLNEDKDEICSSTSNLDEQLHIIQPTADDGNIHFTNFTKDTLISRAIVPLINNAVSSKGSKEVTQNINEPTVQDYSYRTPNYTITDDVYSDLKLFDNIPMNSSEFESSHDVNIDIENNQDSCINVQCHSDTVGPTHNINTSNDETTASESLDKIVIDPTDFSINIHDVSFEVDETIELQKCINDTEINTNCIDSIIENVVALKKINDETETDVNMDNELQEFVDNMLILPTKKLSNNEMKITVPQVNVSSEEFTNNSGELTTSKKHEELINYLTFNDVSLSGDIIQPITENTTSDFFATELISNEENITVTVNPFEVVNSTCKDVAREDLQLTADLQTNILSSDLTSTYPLKSSNLAKAETKTIDKNDNTFRIVRDKNKKRVKLYVCVICGQEFSNKMFLHNHRQYNHNCYNGNQLSVTLGITKRGNKYVCELCNKEFTKNVYLKRHIESAHNENRKRNYICECGIAYFNRFDLINHLKRYDYKPHRCPYFCKLCKNVFPFKKAYLQHNH